jgi:hypothetical protein
MECPLRFECEVCGSRLVIHRDEELIMVEPCDWCLERARDEEHDGIQERWEELNHRR